LVILRKTPLAEAKAHLSELVDEAEHRGRRILILRHGKPAAAIVPVEVATPTTPKPKPMAPADAKALLDELAQLGDRTGEAVRDLIESRR
jgi:prevent-host-death family protein